MRGGTLAEYFGANHGGSVPAAARGNGNLEGLKPSFFRFSSTRRESRRRRS
jgi:hypothetical protein